MNDLNLDGKNASFHLILPLFDPRIWADFIVCLLEILAWLVVGATQFLAPVKVQEHLVAVTCLVCVWETWIEWCCGEIRSGNCLRIRDLVSSHVECLLFVKCYLEKEK